MAGEVEVVWKKKCSKKKRKKCQTDKKSQKNEIILYDVDNTDHDEKTCCRFCKSFKRAQFLIFFIGEFLKTQSPWKPVQLDGDLDYQCFDAHASQGIISWHCLPSQKLIKTTWENLQIAKHKSARRLFCSTIGFMLCDLQISTGKVYRIEQPHIISFSISNSFQHYIQVFCECKRCTRSLPLLQCVKEASLK